MPKPVGKAIFPVGGLGTRFLPATKAVPKEMLPVVDKPLIQYAVEEARAAGIEQLVFVTARGKSAIEDLFAAPAGRNGLRAHAAAARARPCRRVRPPSGGPRAGRGDPARRPHHVAHALP